MAVYRADKSKKKAKEEPQSEARRPLSDEAMERLARLMNDSPTIVKLGGTEWEIRSLRVGTQWLIAEEACKIVKNEKMSMGDVIKEFAKNMPSVARVITLALLNDKEKIHNKETYSEVYDMLLWSEDIKLRDWAMLLFEILKMVDMDFFFASTNVVQTIREKTLSRKKMAHE